MVRIPGGVPGTVAALIVVVALAACGAGTAESTAPSASQPAASEPAASEPAATPAASQPAASEAASMAPEPASPAGEMGSFTVNETEFAVNLLNRCIPFSDAPGNIDLQALATGAQLNLYLSGGTVEVSVQGSAVEQEFGSIAFGEDPVVNSSDVTDDRWNGSATVGDSLGSGATVDLEWDVMIPSEINDCSL